MPLKSTICDIVHHACQTRPHCLTMISNFKLSSEIGKPYFRRSKPGCSLIEKN